MFSQVVLVMAVVVKIGLVQGQGNLVRVKINAVQKGIS